MPDIHLQNQKIYFPQDRVGDRGLSLCISYHELSLTLIACWEQLQFATTKLQLKTTPM